MCNLYFFYFIKITPLLLPLVDSILFFLFCFSDTTDTFVCEQLNSFLYFLLELPVELQLMFLNFNFFFFTYTRVTWVIWKNPFAIGALQMTQTTSVGKNIHKKF